MKYIQTFDAINEAKKSAVHKAAKKGSYPAVIVVVQDGKVIHQEPVSTPEVAPATFNVMQEKYPKALLHLEDNTGKRLFSESVVTEAAYANASRNELAQYIINLSNELKAAKIAKDKKEIKYLEKDIAEVKAALDKKKNESVVTNEEYDGVISDFKYEFPIKFEEETGNNTKAIKKIAKKGKGYEVRTSTYMSQAEMEKVGLALGLKLKSYVKDSRVSISIYESVNEDAGSPKYRYLDDMSRKELLDLRRRSDFPKFPTSLKRYIKSLIDGKEDDESVTEAAKIETERYVRSHGKKPKGYGGWMFSYNRDGSDEWQIPNGMSWPDAQKWAKKKAKEDGEDYVYVMENESVVTEAEDYKYKKSVAKAFDDINDAMFAFRNAMGVKQLGQADKDLKKKLDDMQASIFALQREMKSKGLTESVVNEATDLNDPVLVAFRRTRAIMELPKFKPAEVKSRRISFDKYMIRLDLQADIAEDIKNKAEEMAQTLRDMEQEAEPEGGEIADEYGSIMMKQEKEYIQLKAKKAKIDARIEKYRMS